MGLAAIRKSDDREALRAAIAAYAAVEAKADRREEAVERARILVTTAEAKVNAAGEMLEGVRADHAKALAACASGGQSPKPNGALRNARLMLSDAEDEAEAARTAFEQLRADRGELDQAQAENVVLVEVARVLALTGAELLARAQRTRAELLILKEALYALTSEDVVGVPLFGGEIARLNAQDARRAPLATLREEVLKLSCEPRAEELATAREAVKPYVQWRSALRRNSDAVPEV
jgi:hypothetical protein